MADTRPVKTAARRGAKAAAPIAPFVSAAAQDAAEQPRAAIETIKAAVASAPKPIATAAAVITPAVEAVQDVPVKAADIAEDSAKAATETTVAATETVADAVETVTAAAGDAATATIDRVAEAAAAAPVFTPAQPAAPAATNPLKGFMTMATAAAPANAQAVFGDMNDRAKGMLEKTSRMGEEMAEFTKGNVEAIVASARVAAKGSEAMAQDAAEFGKKSFEQATAAFKSLASAKSPTELFQLQSDFAKTSFDAAVAEASKNSEAMLKLMGEIFQPLSNRYAVASEKMKATTTAAY